MSGRREGREGRAGRWAWGEEARVALAEGAGAALLVLLSCLPPERAWRAAAAGPVVALLVQCLDRVSGAMYNPAVTLAALLWGRVSAPRAAAMVAAQLAGAALGAAALHALAPGGGAAPGVTQQAPGYAAWRAACVEAAAAGCLALANCAAWDRRNAGLRDSWPLRIGTCVAALSLAAGEATGASMNPARSFGPALLAAQWRHHWASVYTPKHTTLHTPLTCSPHIISRMTASPPLLNVGPWTLIVFATIPTLGYQVPGYSFSRSLRHPREENEWFYCNTETTRSTVLIFY